MKHSMPEEITQDQSLVNTCAARPTLSWRLALRSRAVWALVASVFACQWNDFVMPMALPGYLKEVMKMPITENGFYSSLPFLLMIVSTPVSGVLGDRVERKSGMSLTALRKLFTALGLFGPAVLLAVMPLLASPVAVTVLFMLAVVMATMSVVGKIYTNNTYNLTFWSIFTR